METSKGEAFRIRLPETAGRLLALVERVLEILAGLEAGVLAGLDGDGGAGRGVAALARRALADAEAAAEAGAAAIVVSNHGGRVLDGMPGTARVLPAISAWVRQHASPMQIFADGGIRSGADVFRMLALGADAVLIGRPIAIMAVGLGRVGVQSLMNHYITELRQTMRVLGISRLDEIRPTHVTRFV